MPVVLAYINTPEGDAALSAAIEEALRRKTSAVVVNVTRPAAVVGPEMSAEQRLDTIADHFRSSGVEVQVRQLPAGTDVAEGIVSVATQAAADVVVIGLRRRTAVGKLILGSTSQKILCLCDSPVLTIKADTAAASQATSPDAG